MFQIFFAVGSQPFKNLGSVDYLTRNRAKTALHHFWGIVEGDDEKGELLGGEVPVRYEIREKKSEDKWKDVLKRRIEDPRARRKRNETANFRMSKPAIATKEEIQRRNAPSISKEEILAIVDRYSSALIFAVVKEATLPIIEKYSDRDKGYDDEYGGDGLEYFSHSLENRTYSPKHISRDIKLLNDKDYLLFLSELQKEFKNIRNLSFYQGMEEDYETGTYLGSKGRRSESTTWPKKFRFVLTDEDMISESSYETIDEYWEDRGITADKVLAELTSALNKAKSSLQGKGLFNNAKKVFGDYSRKIVRGEKK
jgi:hypothetical protein